MNVIITAMIEEWTMWKISNNQYILSYEELDELSFAAQKDAYNQMRFPRRRPAGSRLPYIINQANLLLRGYALFTKAELSGGIAGEEGAIIQDLTLYKKIVASFDVVYLDIHGIYGKGVCPDNPDWYCAIADVFEPHQKYKIYFVLDEWGDVQFKSLERWSPERV